MRRILRLLTPACFGSLLAAACSTTPAPSDGLPRYLSRPEPETRWEIRSEETTADGTLTELALTSQTWRGIPWKHTVLVARPTRMDVPDLVLLVVAGGRGSGNKDRTFGLPLARAVGVPVAVLYDVPNQPLFGGLREDDLIAHTFEQFVRTGDSEWPLLFPMTKAAVRAMDAVQKYARGAGWDRAPARFVVTGASKRGWTTWLTAAGDPRVAGIVPIVYDNLNLGPQMKHQLDTWGAYGERIGDYTRRHLQEMLQTDAGRRLAAMVDPYTYREPLARVPKLIVNGTNDPYWPLDALNLYWDGLEGGKSALYVPNGGHGIAGDARATAATAAFVRRIGAGRPMPNLRWEHGRDGGALTLRILPGEPPAAVRVWSARSPTRDFRQAQWKSSPAASESDGAWTASATLPDAGFLALFGEVDYNDGERPFSLSTTIRLEGARTR